ncbi:MAG: MFS transporter [Acidimicrobiales bacterium]|nr:MFS transporter [Acidimicrobiales bacterium]
MRLRLVAGDTFRSLKVRNYRLFFLGQLVSQAGTWMQLVAVIWVVYRLTDDGVTLGLVTATQFLPVLLFGAWAGVVADRVDHHRFMIGTQVAFTVIAVAFAGLVLTDRLSLPAIYVLSTGFGFVTALDNPVRRALVVDLVESEDVPNAVALNSSLMTGSRVIGPSVAGAVISGAGVEWCFVVNAITYGAVLYALMRMDRSCIRSSPKVSRAKGQLREGLRYAWREPRLRLPLLLLTVIGTLAFEFQVTLPLLAERALDGGANTFTLLYSVMSVGSVIGALGIARRRDVSTHLLAWAAIWLGVSMALLALAPNVPLALLAAIPVGMATIVLISGANAVVQLRTTPEMRGRVLALTAVVFIGSTPIGGPIAGWFGEHYGAPAGMWLGAVSSVVAGAAVLVELRRLGIQPPAIELATAGEGAARPNR